MKTKTKHAVAIKPIVRTFKGSPVKTAILQAREGEWEWGAFLDLNVLPTWVAFGRGESAIYQIIPLDVDGVCETRAHAKEKADAEAAKLFAKFQKALKKDADQELKFLARDHEEKARKIRGYVERHGGLGN